MTEPLTAEQEALFREGLRTAATVDGSQRTLVDVMTAQWADRCRQLLATLDAARADAESAEARLDVALKASARAFDESLDAAWAEAEAALPEGWIFWEMTGWPLDRAGGVSIRVRLTHDIEVGHEVNGRGPTPAAALRALVARLKEKP